MASRIVNSLEDGAIRQSIIICGCAILAGVILSKGAQAREIESMSKAEAIVQALNEEEFVDHKESCSLYAPNDSYLLQLLKSEAGGTEEKGDVSDDVKALKARIKELETELAAARK